jgi:hypothetical protein
VERPTKIGFTQKLREMADLEDGMRATRKVQFGPQVSPINLV